MLFSRSNYMIHGVLTSSYRHPLGSKYFSSSCPQTIFTPDECYDVAYELGSAEDTVE